MSRKRWDRPNDNYDHYNRNRHYRSSSPFFIIDFVFEMLGLGLKIAFTVLGSVFDLLGSIFSSANNRQDRRSVNMNMGNNNTTNSSRNTNNTTSSTSDASKGFNHAGSANTNTENKKEASSNNTQPRNNRPKDNTSGASSNDEKAASDWNIVIFILTLIPVIVFLAMEELILAGTSVVIGTIIMIVYNILKSIIRAARKNKSEKPEKVESQETPKDGEESEVEKLIKVAFDKVYTIRKNLNRVSNQEIRAKVDNLCGMAEKIIGEVRTNPENIKIVKKFFYYYLDAFNDIFNRYLRIYNFNNSSEEINKTIQETEKSFNDIENIFKDLCEDLIENDAMNIKATINVMKNS